MVVHLDRRIDPGKVFDQTLPLEKAAEGYKAMDERRANSCSAGMDDCDAEYEANQSAKSDGTDRG